MIFDKNIDNLTKDDLQDLIGGEENHFLEFKEQLDTKNEKQKEEFLKDVSAFANSSGGYILLGIEEKNGFAHKIVGVDFDQDRDIQKLESILHSPSSLRPRLSNFRIKPIDIENNNKKVVIIEIQPSLNAPHQVTFNGDNRFYVRNSKGKNQPDVDQLRQLFLGSEGIQQKIQYFRDSSISRVMNRDTPVPFHFSPSLAIHVIPYSIYKNSDNFSIPELRNLLNYFKPYGVEHNLSEKINIDGLVLFPPDTSSSSYRAYTQIWRNGCVEAISELPICNTFKKVISNELKKYILTSYRFLDGFKALNINSSVVFFISLLQVRNYPLDQTQNNNLFFDREIIKLSDLVIEDISGLDESMFKNLLKPVFDEIANAAGLIEWNDELAPKRY